MAVTIYYTDIHFLSECHFKFICTQNQQKGSRIDNLIKKPANYSSGYPIFPSSKHLKTWKRLKTTNSRSTNTPVNFISKYHFYL